MPFARSPGAALTSGIFRGSRLDLELAEGDLLDRASLERAARGCKALFHVAADYRLWAPDPQVLYRTNVEGSRDLLTAAAEAGVERMVYTSSVATLGINRDGSPADEETPSALADMIGHYKRSKFLAEQAVQELAVQGVPVVIVNPSAPIGPRDIKPTPTGRTILDAAAGRMPAYVDTGLNVAHVDDVARGHLLAFERGEIGRRYILGGTDMSLRDILCEVASIVGGRPPRVCVPHNLLMPFAHIADRYARYSGREPRLSVDALRMSKKRMYFVCSRAKQELGYSARPARRAIEDAVAWFSEHGYLAPRLRNRTA
jgi:dihydroflavonol-4-reductase